MTLASLKHIFLMGLIFTWVFSGWPPIWDNPQIPPKIQTAWATTAGPNFPSTAVNVASADTDWTNPGNATATDDSKAEASLPKSGRSDYLKATGFGFSIPAGSTIQGITVEWEQSDDLDGGSAEVRDNAVRIVKTDAIGATDKSNANNWTTTDTFVSYGGVSDLWGETWTADDINSATFGAAISAKDVKISGGGSARIARIDSVRITVTYGPPSITVGTTGTQTANMNIPSTNQYVGGAWTFIRSGGTANVTSITISETDATLSAQSYLANLDLYYETAASCVYDGVETLFGTDTAFDASEDAVITGTMAVGTSQVCVYAVIDVVSGAPDADTFDLEITNPSTEVIVSAGDVTPATAVAISGATTLNLPANVFQDHYRWRNDNGPQGDTNQTLYFNPIGNGFGTADFTIVAAACAVGSEWDCVDDGTADTQSTAPTSDLETSELTLAAATDYYTLANDALPAGVTVTQLDITVAGADDIGNPNTSITLGYCVNIASDAVECGVADAMGSAQAVNGADQTKTQQFTGLSINTTRMNAMELVLTGSGVKAEISTLYVLVTYTVPAATWATGAEDQALSTLAKNTNIRLRFQADNIGGSANSYNYRLEWAAQSGTCDTGYVGESYVAVPDVATTEHFDMTLSGSSLYVDGDPTTAQLSNAESYTFVAGDTVESTSNQSGAITLANNQYTEVEYVFQANTNATDGGVYCFRVTNAGTALNSADVVAQVTLAGGGGGSTLTFSLGATSVNLGALSSGAVNSGSHTITVGTNATNGVAVTYSGATLTSGANTITAMSTAAASSVGTEQFGINAKDNATPNVGLECSGTTPIAAAATGYSTVDNFKFVSGETIVSSAGPINDTTCTISYIANITSATEAGSYTTTLTYIATGNF